MPSYSFLISEHTLCKESIVNVKKIDFEILTYLYVSRSPEFSYAIFAVMYACMCVCVCVCMHVPVYVSEHDSIQTVHSIDFKFGMYITGHRPTYCV